MRFLYLCENALSAVKKLSQTCIGENALSAFKTVFKSTFTRMHFLHPNMFQKCIRKSALSAKLTCKHHYKRFLFLKHKKMQSH